MALIMTSFLAKKILKLFFSEMCIVHYEYGGLILDQIKIKDCYIHY